LVGRSTPAVRLAGVHRVAAVPCIEARAIGLDKSLEKFVSLFAVSSDLVYGIVSLLSSIGAFLVGRSTPAVRLARVHRVAAVPWVYRFIEARAL